MCGFGDVLCFRHHLGLFSFRYSQKPSVTYYCTWRIWNIAFSVGVPCVLFLAWSGFVLLPGVDYFTNKVSYFVIDACCRGSSTPQVLMNWPLRLTFCILRTMWWLESTSQIYVLICCQTLHVFFRWLVKYLFIPASFSHVIDVHYASCM